MRIEHLYVHCIRPDRPDGTLFEGGLEVVPDGELDTPDVIEKVSGERLCWKLVLLIAFRAKKMI